MIIKKQIPKTDMRLGRNIEHDSRSLEFAFDTIGLQIVDVTHERYVPIFNQENTSSCTGNAGIGSISTTPFLNQNNTVYTRDESGALELYSAAEKIDGGAGYPPEDVGSSGLSIAKALTNANLISSYQHVFTLNDVLKAGSLYPLITGITWYSDMFTPDDDGRVHPTGSVAGGHEIELSQIDVENGRIWFNNSWGSSWGIQGRFYITWQDYETLLLQGGDAIVLIPPTITPPIPTTAQVIITRTIDDGKETRGMLKVGSFSCDTLELSWKNNEPNLSCIPKGQYQAVWSFIPDQNVYHYELQKVQGRSGIFLHSGNYATGKEIDTKGCILVGASFADIDGNGELDITSSKITLSEFEQIMAQKPFTLTIQ